MADDDATVQVAEPESTDPVKAELYRYRGETVSIGSTTEWIIRVLAVKFAGDTEPRRESARRWEEIKAYLRDRDLTSGLQPQLAAVATYFRVRQLAAHAAVLVSQVGESTQIFRLYYSGATMRVDLATIDDLRTEVATARAGYNAAREIARVLDADQPAVLAGLGTIPKFMLVGQP